MKKKKNLLNNIDKLIGKSNQMQNLAQLEAQRQQNLNAFKQFAPALFAEYQHYQAQNLQLKFDQQNEINIYDNNRQSFVYQTAPEELVKQQLAAFQKDPGYLKVELGLSKPAYDFFFQTDLVNSLIKDDLDELNQFKGNLDAPIGLMVVIGIGLGYHLDKLLDKYHIQHLIVIEAEKDIFYASLHTYDWQGCLKKINQEGKTLNIFINKSTEDNIASLRGLSLLYGQHQLANAFVFEHLLSPANDALIEAINISKNIFVGAQGFIEDEQIGMAHTAKNSQLCQGIFKLKEPIPNLPPVFIIGNGPSLDTLKSLLLKHQHNAIIISCGSSIGTLYQYGITPDIHIEMERTAPTTDIVKEMTDAEYLKKIILFALNTVPPSLLNLFKQSFLINKDCDSGALLLNQCFNHPIAPLTFANPTCTNTALALSLTIGFNNIYLWGVDLGMVDKTKHHAKDSAYFTDISPSIISDTEKANLKVKGNFRETVLTKETLLNARNNMTLAISHHSNQKVYNLNDGAYIEGTIPLEPKQFPNITNPIDKTEIIKTIINQAFINIELQSNITQETLLKNALNQAINFLNQDNFAIKPKTLKALHLHLSKLFETITNMANQSPISFSLINGSHQTFFYLIMRLALLTKNEASLSEKLSKACPIFKQFQEKSSELIRCELLKTHQERLDNES